MICVFLLENISSRLFVLFETIIIIISSSITIIITIITIILIFCTWVIPQDLKK